MSLAHSQAAGRALSSPARWALVRLLPVLALLVLVSVLMDPGRPTGDEVPLIAAAHRILQGRYAVIGTMDGTKFLWHGPGLPALLAPFVALGVPLQGLRLISPLLMFVAVLLFYRLLRLRLSRRGALIGAYALGLYAPAYYVIGTVSKDPLALVLSIGALDGTARYLKYHRPRAAVIAGLSLAALAMTRLEYGWVLAAALAVALGWWTIMRARDRRVPERTQAARRWALICALGMLACLPWLLYTYALTGRPFYWGNSGGISLYWMSSPSLNQLGEWHASHTVFANAGLAAYRPFFHYLATLGPVQGDLELQHVAVVQALAHPAKYGLNLLANVGRTFFGFPFSFTLPAAVIAGLIAFNGALLVGLVAAGTSLIRCRSRLPDEALPFVAFAVVGFCVHLFPTSEPRMMIPLIPVPIWLMSQALHRRTLPRSSLVRAIPAPRPIRPPAEVPLSAAHVSYPGYEREQRVRL
jgi:hypothetical protein